MYIDVSKDHPAAVSGAGTRESVQEAAQDNHAISSCSMEAETMAYTAYNDPSLGFTTRQLHAGYDPDEDTYGSKAVPIYQSAAYSLKDIDNCIDIFKFAREGQSYSRFQNPTNDILERRIASLDGGAAAVSFGSGMAAITNTILNLCQAGDNIVLVRTIYGGTTNLLQHILPQYGICGRFVDDPDDPEAFRAQIDEHSKAVYVECLGNPLINIPDFDTLSEIAHEAGIPFVVDNTFATPYLFRTFEHGADIAVYSATKYLCGHGTTIAGLVVEKGGFNWLSGKFPQFEDFNSKYRDWVGGEKMDRIMFSQRLRQVYLCDVGANLSPVSAWLILQGIETLSLRMREHSRNAEAVAEFLEQHPAVREVSYPTLKSSKYHKLAGKYFPLGCSGMMMFRVKGSQEDAASLLEKVHLFGFMVNVGDAHSLITHPATSTHFGQPEEVLHGAGIYPDSIRLSIGIEDKEDLIQDLGQALDTLL